MGALLVPYLVKDYAQAYAMLNGKIGDTLDKQFQEKYKLKVLYYFDYGFRHFWTNGSAIVEPKDLRGKKIRVQLAKVFSDTINGLGGNAVPMAWGEVVSAAKQGVIDGADLPIYNINALKVYEVSKYVSMTFHNYGPTLLVMNLEVWKSLTPEQQKLFMEVSREAQKKIRELTESVDNLAKAKEILEAKGMKVNAMASTESTRVEAMKVKAMKVKAMKVEAMGATARVAAMAAMEVAVEGTAAVEVEAEVAVAAAQRRTPSSTAASATHPSPSAE